MGPVEYLVVSFPENHFSGAIAHELQQLSRNGTIHVLDLVFVSKGADGDVVTFEVENLGELAPFAELEGEVGGLIGPDDIRHAAADLAPNSSAALLVWEDLWATPFVEALAHAGAVVIEGARIPASLIEDALAEPSVSGASAR
jgi:hypothetical protein